MIPDFTGTPRNLIPEYGRLTIENIEANMQNFIVYQISKAQKSVQLFHCLTNSMKEAAYLKIFSESNKYMDDDTPVGELIFKLMIQKAIIYTRATATRLRKNLANLDT